MMSSSDFVHFGNSGEEHRSRKYAGYLSFLPVSLYRAHGAAIAHRYLAHDHLYWLELKDEIPQETSTVQLEPQYPCLWIVLALMGDCTLHYERAATVASGNLLCFASNKRDLSIALSGGKNWVFMLGFQQQRFDALITEFPYLESLKQVRDGVASYWVGEERPISSRLRAILESLRRFVFQSFSTPIQLAGWSLRLLNYLSQESKGNDVDTGETDDISYYHQAAKFIREHYQEDISLEKVADAIHISVRNLTRSFENRPYTVNGYISHLRLTKARELLAFSDRPVKDIAYALRFSCPKHFSKMFKQKFKKSPVTYRGGIKKEKLGLDRSAFHR